MQIYDWLSNTLKRFPSKIPQDWVEQNNFVLAGVSVPLVVSFFILSLKAMNQSAILCRLASGLVCISKLVSQSVSYLRAAIL